MITHLEFLHEIPGYTDLLRRLAAFARVITFDKSGQGLSDRYPGMPSFEQRVDDIRAVMEAVGSSRAVLLGCSEGGPISIMFAATFPERVSHLVLFGSFARFSSALLFADIVESTARAAEMGDQAWRRVLDEHDGTAQRIVVQHRGNLVKTTGDGILATFDGPGRAIRCALAFGAATRRLGLAVRAGLHTGEIELRNADIGGIAVHCAARVMALAGPNEVLVSRVVTDLVAGAGLKFSDRGTHTLKGLPGVWDVFAASA